MDYKKNEIKLFQHVSLSGLFENSGYFPLFQMGIKFMKNNRERHFKELENREKFNVKLNNKYVIFKRTSRQRRNSGDGSSIQVCPIPGPISNRHTS